MHRWSETKKLRQTPHAARPVACIRTGLAGPGLRHSDEAMPVAGMIFIRSADPQVRMMFLSGPGGPRSNMRPSSERKKSRKRTGRARRSSSPPRRFQ